MLRTVLAVAVPLAGAAGALAQEPWQRPMNRQIIGKWSVSAEEDRFGDGTRTRAELKQGRHLMAVDCHERGPGLPPWLTIRVAGHFVYGDLYKVKVRVDTRPVVDTPAFGASERFIEISRPQRLVKQMMDGREIAFRVVGGNRTVDTVFQLGQAGLALADVAVACPLDRR